MTASTPHRPTRADTIVWPDLLDAAEVGDIIKMSRSAVLRLMGDELPGYKIGGKWFVDAADLQTFLAAKRHSSRTGWSDRTAAQRGVA